LNQPTPENESTDEVTATKSEPAARHLRSVRSFVVRAGRMTVAQERAWQELWPVMGVPDADGPLDLDALFGRAAPRTLEIGFGNGESLVTLAQAHPDRDYLGVEVHRPGVGHLMLRAEELGLLNVRAICRDAVEVLQQCIVAGALDEVLLYFPDPWPKKRHHKRRIVQPAFVALVASRLRPGGVLRMATDWQPYAEHMLEVATGCDALCNAAPTGDYVPRPDSRPLTRFERRGQRLGHGVWDLAFSRT
jgi:tRNA (guanine-N7-)-methyltransferase